MNAFLGEIVMRGKGGGNRQIWNAQVINLSSDTLLVSLPFRGAGPQYGLFTPRHYVLAAYANNWADQCPITMPCPANTNENADKQVLQAEMLRAPIREALATW